MTRAHRSLFFFVSTAFVFLLSPFTIVAQPTNDFSPKALNQGLMGYANNEQPPENVSPPTCRSLAKIHPQLYRCGDYLLQLKDGAVFPEDAKKKPWDQAAKQLKAGDLILKVWKSSPDDIVLARAPNDSRFGEQQYVNGEGAADIGAQEAWGTVTGKSSVVVAVIDSGLLVDHPDLKDNLWKNDGEVPGNGADDDGNGYSDDAGGYDFEAGVPDVRDVIGHGTQMSGVIGATGDNAAGIAGVNWSVRIMPLKFTGSAGNGSLAAALEAINYAVENGAKVINASWTLAFGGADAADKASLLSAAVQSAIDAGVVFVAASGNQFETGAGKNIDAEPVYPAAAPAEALITVAAVNADGTLAPFANVGANAVDLAAPGASVLTTSKDGEYGFVKGTSIATAFVSGAAALLLADQPSLAPAQVRRILLDHAVAEASLSGKVATGGRLSLKGIFSTASSAPTTGAPADASATAKTDGTTPATKASASESSGSSGGCSLLVLSF